MTGNGTFVVSLDFELLWGLRDHADRSSYGRNILGVREAIPRILETFEQSGLRATWATVGFLFCENRDELMDSLPPSELRPSYAHPNLSNYRFLDEVGQNEAQDPYYFGTSLIEKINDCPGQEVGSHTFSHFYCLEDGATDAALDADLEAAIALAKRRGINLKSIVFPRNQFASRHIEICRRHGLRVYRGTPKQWAYRPTPGQSQHLHRRALRLVDAYTGLLGAKSSQPCAGISTDVPASQFLRPTGGWLSTLHPLHIRSILAGMSEAARSGRCYHLWWHPHNFGANIDANIAALQRIGDHFRRLNETHGMVSRSMGDLAA